MDICSSAYSMAWQTQPLVLSRAAGPLRVCRGQAFTSIDRSASDAVMAAAAPGLLLPSHQERDYDIVPPYELTTHYK